MLEVRYNPQFPPLISLCVSSLMGRGYTKCIPDTNSPGALVFASSVSDGSRRELMNDVACAKLLSQLSLQTSPLYPSSGGATCFGAPAEVATGGSARTTGAAAAAAAAAAVDLLTPIDAMISLALAAQGNTCRGAAEAQLLSQLSSHLQLRTFLAARHLTLADVAVYAALKRMLAAGGGGGATAGAAEAAGVPGGVRGVATADSGTSNSSGVPALWEKKYPHLARWFAFLDGHGRLASCVTEALRKAELQQKQQQQKLSSGDTVSKTSSRGEGGAEKKKGRDAGPQASYEGKLEGAIVGEVVTRFPPEPSGYLHIGHAKAALLNDYFAKKYKGKMLFRFDDTNPAKEKEEYEESIREDLRLLHVDWAAVSHSSDYFEQMQNLCERLIREGKFYVDDTPTEVMREQRGEGIASCRRDDSVEENLKRWKEMLAGSAVGVQCCVRARIDMQSKNKCMRDPVMYRCIPDIPHHRCGTKFKIYPTYDFACPVIDALEGVTHALRTNEYADRIPQYHWVQEAAGLRRVRIYEFSRLCFVRTLLSKRKLKYFVDNKLVDGWDDPRMPTVRGILRRGLQVEALLDFMLEQGASKAGNLMEWDKLWTINKQRLDPVVPRYMAVGADAVPVFIKGAPCTPERKARRLHAKNEALGSVDLWFCNQILIDRDDAALCVDGEEVTLMHIGNCFFDKIVKSDEGTISRIEATLHLEGDFKKTKKKLHWVPNLEACPVTAPTPNITKNSSVILREFDHLITADKIEGEQEESWEQYINKQTVFDTQALGDPLLCTLQEGALLQLERRGYFRVDQIGEKTVLIKIPDGKSKAMSVVSSKVDAAKLSGTKKVAKK